MILKCHSVWTVFGQTITEDKRIQCPHWLSLDHVCSSSPSCVLKTAATSQIFAGSKFVFYKLDSCFEM